MKIMLALVLCLLPTFAFADQPWTPTAVEIQDWTTNPKPLMNWSCKQIVYSVDLDGFKSWVPQELGAFGQGFVSGGVFVASVISTKVENELMKAFESYGLSRDVASAQLTAYCYGHPTKTVVEAALDLFFKVTATAK